MISLYPKLKYTDEMIEDIKNLNMDNTNENKVEEEKKNTEENNNIKEDSRAEIKEKRRRKIK